MLPVYSVTFITKSKGKNLIWEVLIIRKAGYLKEYIFKYSSIDLMLHWPCTDQSVLPQVKTAAWADVKTMLYLVC